MVCDASKARALAQMFDGCTPQELIRDLRVQVGTIEVAGRTLPFTLSDSAPNCYLCAPTTAYIDYAIEELVSVDMPSVIAMLSRAGIRACTPLLSLSGLDRQVQINNWLVSTNPVPDLGAQDINDLTRHCTQTYPDRAIVIRSLNDLTDAGMIEQLRAAGFFLLAARQIFVIPRGDNPSGSDVRRDAKLLGQTRFDLVDGADFAPPDFERCEDLYRQLYLTKYTALNPHYTAAFFEQSFKRGISQFKGLREDGELIGFTGLMEVDGTLTQPFLGYDTQRPMSDGLYRMLMHIGRHAAIIQGLTYNMSAGAASFKRNRGAQDALEYTAVYVAHLPRAQRWATSLIGQITRRIGIPLVRKFET